MAEARERLRGKGFSEEEIEQTIQKAMEAGLLDDRLFTELWVEERLNHRPLARRAIRRELEAKGITPEIIDGVMSRLYPPEREPPIAIELAQRRLARYRGLDDQRKVRRTISYLTRRGFPLFMSKKIVRTLLQQENNDA
ncbi:MAG: regulatory protein RecX [Candidatus Bipolaricaulota bacterium]|nr:regulatory protein RecX [Candidatus Bipolaricaulota bacterium]